MSVRNFDQINWGHLPCVTCTQHAKSSMCTLSLNLHTNIWRGYYYSILQRNKGTGSLNNFPRLVNSRIRMSSQICLTSQFLIAFLINSPLPDVDFQTLICRFSFPMKVKTPKQQFFVSVFLKQSNQPTLLQRSDGRTEEYTYLPWLCTTSFLYSVSSPLSPTQFLSRL